MNGTVSGLNVTVLYSLVQIQGEQVLDLQTIKVEGDEEPQVMAINLRKESKEVRYTL